MSDKDNRKIKKITQSEIKEYRKNKAGIFMEASIQCLVDAYGVKEATKRMKYYIDVLEELGPTK